MQALDLLVRRPVMPDVAAPLQPRERARLVAEVLVDYARVRWGLARGGLVPTLAAMRASRPAHPAAPAATAPPTDVLVRLGHVVARTLGVLPIDSRCLIRSLVLTAVLARRGVPSVLVLAARLQPEFGAHSWIEHDGVALLETGTAFQRLKEL